MGCLDGENSGGGFEIGLMIEIRSGAVISSDADVFEDECAQQEAGVVGEGIECLSGGDDAGGDGGVGERVDEIDGWLGNRIFAQGVAQKAHVIQFIGGNFGGVLCDYRAGKRYGG